MSKEQLAELIEAMQATGVMSEEFYRLLAKMVGTLAVEFHGVRDEHLLDDLRQEMVVRVYRDVAKIDTSTNPFSYLTGMAGFIIKNYVRKQVTQPAALAESWARRRGWRPASEGG